MSVPHPHRPRHPQHAHHQPPPYGRGASASAEPLHDVDDARRGLASMLDGAGAVYAGVSVSLAVADDAEVSVWWGITVAACLAVSFVNHVVLTLLVRGSVGKFLLGLRVVRDPGDRLPAGGFRRPGFWRTVGRWADGLLYVPGQPLLALVGSDGEAAGNKLGVRVVRRRDLVAAGR